MRIVAALRDREEELVDRGVAAIRAEIPAYTRIDDPAFLADMQEHVHQHNDALLRSLARQSPLTAEELLFVRPVATRRVGRIPLGDFMHAFRLYEVFWEAVLETVTDDESRAAALSMVSIVIRYINVAATYASEAYLEAESLLQAQGERLRRDLLEDLLDGRPPAPKARRRARGRARAVAAMPPAGGEGRSRRRGRARAAVGGRVAPRARGGAAVQPLTVVRQDEIVVVGPATGVDVTDLAATLTAIQTRLAEQGITLAIGMSTIQPLEDLPAAYAEACQAVERLDEAGGVLALPTLRVRVPDDVRSRDRGPAREPRDPALRRGGRRGRRPADHVARVRRRRPQRNGRGREALRPREHRSLPAEEDRRAHRLRPAPAVRGARPSDRGTHRAQRGGQALRLSSENNERP